MKKILNKFLDLIFPPSCGFCGEIGNTYLCKYCLDYIKEVQKNNVDKYDNKYFKNHLWIFEYKDEIRSKIIEYKFKDKSFLHKTFSEIILKSEEICNFIEQYDILIPVPIHKQRKKYRGYNQSELIVNEIGEKINSKKIKICNNILEKNKNIKPQSSLTEKERIENVKNVYKFIGNSDEIFKKKILIFDDVFTTGSTVNECAKVLIENGCNEVGILTLAKK